MSRNDDYCSELVAVAYRNIGRTVNIGNKFPTDATPGDLANLCPPARLPQWVACTTRTTTLSPPAWCTRCACKVWRCLLRAANVLFSYGHHP